MARNTFLFAGVLIALAIPASAGAGNRIADNAMWKVNTARGKEALRNRNYVDAETRLEKALSIAQPMGRTDPQGLAVSMVNLAEAYRAQGKNAQAEPLFGNSLSLRERAREDSELVLAGEFRKVGEFYTEIGKHAKAEVVYRRSVDHLEIARLEGLRPHSKEVAVSLLGLASAQSKNGKHVEAESNYKEARKSYEKNPGGIQTGEDRRFIIEVMQGLAGTYAATRRAEEAESLYRQSIRLVGKAFPPTDPIQSSCLESYARFLRAQKRTEEAAEVENKLAALRARGL